MMVPVGNETNSVQAAKEGDSCIEGKESGKPQLCRYKKSSLMSSRSKDRKEKEKS